MTGTRSGIDWDRYPTDPGAGMRSLAASVWIAIGALLFPLLAAILTTVVAGDWRLTGAGTILVAALIATTGAVSAMVAGHHPLTYGALAGEAWALGSVPDPFGMAFTLGAGLAGGWMGGRLMTARRRDPRAATALGAVAAVGGFVLLVVMLVGSSLAGSDSGEGASLPFTPSRTPPSCPPTPGQSTSADIEVQLVVRADHVLTGEPVPVTVEYRLGGHSLDGDVTPLSWTDTYVVFRSVDQAQPVWGAWKGGASGGPGEGRSSGSVDPRPCPLVAGDERRFSTDAPPGVYEATALVVTGNEVWASPPVPFTVVGAAS